MEPSVGPQVHIPSQDTQRARASGLHCGSSCQRLAVRRLVLSLQCMCSYKAVHCVFCKGLAQHGRIELRGRIDVHLGGILPFSWLGM